MTKPRNTSTGFTLAELLICLMILGAIATFTIPKILTSQQTARSNALAKEAFSMISAAHQQLFATGALTTGTYATNLTQYFNYVSVATSGTIDDRPGLSSLTCSASTPCLTLHNGGILQPQNEYFGGTATTNYVGFTFDPDGVYTGNADSVKIYLYYDGRLVDRNGVVGGSKTSGNGTGLASCTTCNPSWFSW